MTQLDISFTPRTGEDLKERGLASVEDNSEPWMRAAVSTLERARLETPWTCDDLREVLEAANLGEPHHPNAWGALARNVAKARGLKIVGYTKSGRASAHVRRIAQWGNN